MEDHKLEKYIYGWTMKIGNKSYYDVPEDFALIIKQLEEENERLNNIIDELEKWLNDVPKYFMSKGSFNSGVSIQQGMQYQIDLTKDKLKKLKEGK